MCGGVLKALGENVTEELEYVPGRLIVHRIVELRMVLPGDLVHRVVFAVLADIGFAHVGLLASEFGKKVSICGPYRMLAAVRAGS